MDTAPTADDVARFMVEEFEQQDGYLAQSNAVWDIERRYGEDFIYTNENGNPAISRMVLKKFRELTIETAVWERSGRYWRRRDERDDPNRRSSD